MFNEVNHSCNDIEKDDILDDRIWCVSRKNETRQVGQLIAYIGHTDLVSYWTLKIQACELILEINKAC